ncbi:MAG: glutamyl-tRNA amidotransferase [Desulfobacter sp.]|nr:MAG: glutamyl-tRNA amidotransferase [Desulfobacter sp.]
MNVNDSDASDPFVTRESIHPHSQGRLSGLSFAVKDNIDIRHQTTGYGSPGWADTHYTPVANAICLEQLLSEGGICKGKTKSDELAYSLLGVNSFYGTPLNPKAPGRIPGGSSSGSASAVAWGAVDFAIGTDTGGSVRVPASNCGVWGYRPSHGAISVAGVLPLAPSFDTVGIISQNGRILEKAMQVLLAEEESEHGDLPRVCFVEEVFQISGAQVLQATDPVQHKIAHHLSHETLALSELTGLNTDFNDLFLHLGFLLSTEIWNTFGGWVTAESPQLSAGVEFSLSNYAASAARDEIQEALFIRKSFQNKLNRFLCEGNILCFPTTVDLAPRLEEVTPEFLAGEYIPRAMCVNAISSLSRTPQITIPISEEGGVPVGLSFIGGYGQDMRLIDFCNKLYTQCIDH